MKRHRSIALTFLLCSSLIGFTQNRLTNDSLTLAQAFVNLSLTAEYSDSIETQRMSSILSFERSELRSIRNSSLIDSNEQLMLFSESLWHYAKAKEIFRLKPDSNLHRKTLLQWKDTLNLAIDFLIEARDVRTLAEHPFYEFIDYNNDSYRNRGSNLRRLKHEFSPYFNRDIYADFKRIFNRAIATNQYQFDSLRSFCNLYNIPLNLEFIALNDTSFTYGYYSHNYRLARALDLIARYLELDYISRGHLEDVSVFALYEAYRDFTFDLNPESARFRYNDGFIEKDDFFETYINETTVEALYQRIRNRYPTNAFSSSSGGEVAANRAMNIDREKYYFPTPAPFPTVKMAIPNFKPELRTLAQVDQYIRQSFIEAGYEGRLHYFYIREPGFAVTTGIERINEDGSPHSGTQRWDLTPGNDDDWTLASIFRAMFFRTESEYRMIACIVSAEEIQTTSQAPSLSLINNLIRKSYASLPADLRHIELVDKTLSVLLYHYTQDDIGKVPKLNQNTILTVRNHFQMTPTLSTILSN